MNLGKEKFLAIIFGAIVLLIAAIFLVNLLPSSSDQETGRITVAPQNTPQTVSPEDITAANDPDRQKSIVELATGEEYDGTPYVMTETDISEMMNKLLPYDTRKETRKQWEKTQDSLIAYTPQDFPREMVMMFAPSEREWNNSGAREFIIGTVEKVGSTEVQGQFSGVWEVIGFQKGYDREGKLIDQFDQRVYVTVQCANKNKDSCRVLSYDAQTPLIQNLY